MSLLARQHHHYVVQAICEKCGIKSPVLNEKTKTDGYMKLKQMGWKIWRNKKKALCKDCL